MKYTLLLTTEYFMDEFAQKELSSFDMSFNVLDEGFYSIICVSTKEFLDTVIQLLHYSRTLTNMYLKVGESDQKLKNIFFERGIFDDSKISKFGIKVIDKDINKKILDVFSTKLQQEYGVDEGNIELEVFDEEEDGYIIVLDLLGFDLTKRSYKLREFEDSLSPLVSSYAMYLLDLDKEEKLSILDPYAQLGDLSIESSLFQPRLPLFVKEKRQTTLAKLFTLPLGVPKKSIDSNKLMAVIEGDETFKYFKENLSYAGTKIKVSQFDFDWLDVKFHKGDFDYILTQFPYFESEEEKQEFEELFFYQAEFVAKKGICVITETEVDQEILEKHNLVIKERREIEMDEEEYLVYVISHKEITTKN